MEAFLNQTIFKNYIKKLNKDAIRQSNRINLLKFNKNFLINPFVRMKKLNKLQEKNSHIMLQKFTKINV